MNNKLRIGFLGTGGSGRASIAKEISEAFGIPFLSSREITQPVIERDGFKYGTGQFIEQFLSIREEELIRKRINLESTLDSFVTDRTTLDHFAYALLSVERFPEDKIRIMESMCLEHISKYTHLFYFSRPDTFRENGVRTLNISFHSKIDYIIRGLIQDWDVPVRKIHTSASIIKNIRSTL